MNSATLSRTLNVGLVSLAMSQLVCTGAVAQSWSYDGDTNGQERWHLLSPENALCGSGTNQSPVNLAQAVEEALPNLTFSYTPTAYTRTTSAQRLELKPATPQVLKVSGERWNLESISVHSPSEHIIGDRFYPLELQFLHRSFLGQMLILSVFAEPQEAENPALGALLSDGASLNLPALLPEVRRYYRYNGSLTTPPCTENVQWLVLEKPIHLSAAQLRSISALIGRNARLVQPLNFRTLLVGGE